MISGWIVGESEQIKKIRKLMFNLFIIHLFTMHTILFVSIHVDIWLLIWKTSKVSPTLCSPTTLLVNCFITIYSRKSWVSHSPESDGKVPVLKLWGMWSTPSQPLLQGPLWPGVLVLFRVPSMSQIEISNHSQYLEPFTYAN